MKDVNLYRTTANIGEELSIKSSVYIATSLDGFIARSDGGIDWLEEANKLVPEGEDCGYFEFMNTVDHLVMGRNSYEKVLSFGSWPYEKKRVVVLSSKELKIPKELRETVSSSSEPPSDLVKRLSSEGAKHLYIDGGITIQRFLSAGLINEITITIIPILLGEGRTLFGATKKDYHLKHISTKSYDFGFVQLKYQVENL